MRIITSKTNISSDFELQCDFRQVIHRLWDSASLFLKQKDSPRFSVFLHTYPVACPITSANGRIL